MILDKYENKDLYANIHPLFKKAFDYVDEFMKNPVAPGTYEICGKDLFVKVQDFETRTEGYLEVHNKYIDVQVMLGGSEKVYCDWRDNLEPVMPYDEAEDALFLKDGKGNIEYTFSAGEIMIFYPWDAHKPAMAIDAPAQCQKLVFKVKLDR